MIFNSTPYSPFFLLLVYLLTQTTALSLACLPHLLTFLSITHTIKMSSPTEAVFKLLGPRTPLQTLKNCQGPQRVLSA